MDPRLRRLAGLVGRGALAAVVVIAFVYLIVIDTGPGRGALAGLIADLSGGEVYIQGLDGGLPAHPHIRQLELRDANGTWLRAEGIALDWNPLSIIFGPLTIDRLQAAQVSVLRMPLPSTSTGKQGPFDIAQIAIVRLDASKAALGQHASFTATGGIDYRSIHDLKIDLDARRLDQPATYAVHAHIAHDILTGAAEIAEARTGISGIVGLPSLGPVTLHARAEASGHRNTFDASLRAGAFAARALGTLDLAARTADASFRASAPAMQPAVGLSWASFSAQGETHGSFDAPSIDASLRISDLKANGIGATAVTVDLSGRGGIGNLDGEIDGLSVPGNSPDIFAGAPVRLAARLQFAEGHQGIDFAASHPLATVKGAVDLSGTPLGTFAVDLPSLGPLAGLAGVKLDGSVSANGTFIRQENVVSLALEGHADTVPDSTLGRLLGTKAAFKLTGLLHNNALAAMKLKLSGAAIAANIDGTGEAGLLDYSWGIRFSDLATIASGFRGNVSLDGTVKGKGEAAHIVARGAARIGTPGVSPERVTLSLNATGFPKPKSGTLSVGGKLAGSPLAVDATITPEKAGAIRIALEKASWKSLKATGAFEAGGGPLRGRAEIAWTRLADLDALMKAEVAGALRAAITLAPSGVHSNAQVTATVSKPVFGGIRADSLRVAGSIEDLLTAPRPALKLAVVNYALGIATGDATATLDGPLKALAIEVKSQSTLAGAPFVVDATAVDDHAARKLTLKRVTGTWSGKPIGLTRAATVDYAHGISVGALDASLGGAHIALSGEVTPKLALSASARDVSPDLLAAAMPSISAEGVLSADAKLAGTLDAPTGTFRLTGKNLRAKGVAATSPASANLDASGTLRAGSADIRATLVAARSGHLDLTGTVPLAASGTFHLTAKGRADLAVLNDWTAASGQTISGRLTLDGTVTGTFAKPDVRGTLTVANASYGDFPRHISLTDINADVAARGTRLDITRFSAKAHQGTITGSGTADLAAAGIPVSLAIHAVNAEPVQSDLITARLDGDLKFEGELERQSTLSGTVKIVSGDINLPSKFPPQVATLNVRKKGAPPPPPPSARVLDLDVTLSVPNRISVRGRGLTADVNGTLKISGSSEKPVVQGALSMIRGEFSLAGQTLDFQTGKVSFEGTSLRYSLDPTLDFVAQTSSAGVTATLKITGYASQPKIELTSVPTLPPDEILARLLFQQSVKQLSPVQYAQIATAVASLSGVGSGVDLVGRLRNSLGLDRLAIGSASTATGAPAGTTIEAGRYVAPGLYLGARENFSGGQRAIVQYDITKNLKLQGMANTGQTATTTPSTPAEDKGSSVGVTYTFDY